MFAQSDVNYEISTDTVLYLCWLGLVCWSENCLGAITVSVIRFFEMMIDEDTSSNSRMGAHLKKKDKIRRGCSSRNERSTCRFACLGPDQSCDHYVRRRPVQ